MRFASIVGKTTVAFLFAFPLFHATMALEKMNYEPYMEPGLFCRAHYYMEDYPAQFGVMPLDVVLVHPSLQGHLDTSQDILDTCNTPEERQWAERVSETYHDWMKYLLSRARYTSLFEQDDEQNEMFVGKLAKDERQGWPTTYVSWVGPNIGYGAFATRDIQAGEIIDIYTGVLLNNSRNNDYAWQYNWDATTLDKHGNTLWLVTDSLRHGNAMRFVNHGEAQYLNVDNIYAAFEGLWYILYVAKRDIRRHEQLFVSYGDNYWATRPLKQPLSNPKK